MIQQLTNGKFKNLHPKIIQMDYFNKVLLKCYFQNIGKNILRKYGH